MKTERITFDGHAGTPLAARLDLPEGPVRAAAMLAHCFTCSKDIAAARRIAARLAARGIAVLRFDFTGLGHSEGEFANTDFSSNVADLVLAARFMASRGMEPQLVIGHSLGGAAAIKAAADIPGLRALVTIGAPADPAHVAHALGESLEHIRRNGAATVTLAGRSFEIRQAFLDDIAEASLTQALRGLGAALLVLHAPRDQTVGIANAGTIFAAARHPKSFVTLDDADHLFTRKADADYVADVIGAWSARYLVMAPEPVRADAPEGVVRVSEADPEGFRQDVAVGPHALVADEPASVGGMDAGPTPYQFLSVALGACTTMTIRMYARRKGIPLRHVAVEVTHNKDYRAACEGCEAPQTKVDVFHRAIRLEGELTDDQRASLMAIADKCPVHRTLHASSVIQTVEA